MSIFKGKSLLITGGTGSFGNAVLKRFLDTDIKEIRIFSRDEKKQDDMRREYKSGKIEYYIGNVRDKASIKDAMYGVDYVFHAAALKQVPSCEFFPMEAVKTNIIGTENVLECAMECSVKKVICLSTDKAAYPINAMGLSKALMEKMAIAKARTIGEKGPVICCTRYGNVMCSRGSVIPLFISQIKSNSPLTITSPDMTRFLMSIDEAVELVLYAFEHGKQGEIFVQKSPASTIDDLATAIIEIFDANSKKRIIGIRHGEKMYETLITSEEKIKAVEEYKYYRIVPDHRGLNYDQYFTEGNSESNALSEYNSFNTKILNVQEIKELLLNLKYVQKELSNYKKV